MRIKNFIYSLCLCLCLAGTSVYAASAGQGNNGGTTTESTTALPADLTNQAEGGAGDSTETASKQGKKEKGAQTKDNKEQSPSGLLDFLFKIVVLFLLIAVVVVLFMVLRLRSQQSKVAKTINDITPKNTGSKQDQEEVSSTALLNKIRVLEKRVDNIDVLLQKLQNQPGANQTSSRTSATAGTSAAAGTVGTAGTATGAASNAASANRYTDDDVNNLFVDAPKQAAPKREPKTYYFESVDDNMYFCGMSETRTGNSVYQLTTIDGVRGDFVVLQGTTAMAAFNATIDLVRNACDYDESLESATNVETEDEGKAVLAGGRWKVSTRAKIKIS